MENHELNMVKEILSKYPYHFYAFGSRTQGKAKKYSDLDLCFKEDIPSHIIISLENDFENSNLPFVVELINWKNCSQEFRDRISKDFKEIK